MNFLIYGNNPDIMKTLNTSNHSQIKQFNKLFRVNFKKECMLKENQTFNFQVDT